MLVTLGATAQCVRIYPACKTEGDGSPAIQLPGQALCPAGGLPVLDHPMWSELAHYEYLMLILARRFPCI